MTEKSLTRPPQRPSPLVPPTIDVPPSVFVSYTEDGADPATRPIVFAFNGGPGSSTVWLHLGLLGPKRVELDDDGFSVRLPGRLIDNEHSILDVADVVLIDAVGTGFSTAEPKDKEKDYHPNMVDSARSVGLGRVYPLRRAAP